MSQFISGKALGFLLTDISRLFRQQFERAVAENGLGLTSGEIRALAHVIRYQGSRQAVLAERMGVEPMTLSAYLDRLEVRGLIRRTTDAADRRAKIIQPTEAADTVMTALEPLFGQIFRQMTQSLGEAEVAAMAEALQTIRANLTNDPALLSDRFERSFDASTIQGAA